MVRFGSEVEPNQQVFNVLAPTVRFGSSSRCTVIRIKIRSFEFIHLCSKLNQFRARIVVLEIWEFGTLFVSKVVKFRLRPYVFESHFGYRYLYSCETFDRSLWPFARSNLSKPIVNSLEREQRQLLFAIGAFEPTHHATSSFEAKCCTIWEVEWNLISVVKKEARIGF